MEEIDRLVLKYEEVRQEIKNLEKKMDKYRNKINDELKRHGLDKYSNHEFQIQKYVTETNRILKKHVPEDIWKQYATPHTCEYLRITRKEKPKA
jgi:predicted translin family RNA/ssDNA-binding protein